MDTPVIQHWIVAVARAAKLAGADRLDIPSDAPVRAAWDVAALQTGVGQDELAARVAAHYRLPVADLASADPHAHKLLPGRVARKLQVLPLRYSDRWIAVATGDPVGMETEREIGQIAGRAVHFEIAPPETLEAAVRTTYPEEAEPRHQVPPLTREAKGGPRVLVVDDDADARLLLRTALAGAGFRVEEAADGRDALDTLAGSEPFDLVTLDLNMAEIGGLEVLRSMRTRIPTAGVPVIVATASDDPEVEVQLFEAGADDFVVKPLDAPRFLLRVKAVLRRRQASYF